MREIGSEDYVDKREEGRGNREEEIGKREEEPNI